MKIRKGSLVLLVGKRNYLVECKGKFCCNYGAIDMNRLVGKPYGAKVRSGKETFVAVRPTLIDFMFKKAKRGPQIILPKDAMQIAAATGCGSGWKTVDAGSGSGFLAMALANIGCDVTTYEKRKDFFELAKRNIKYSGLKATVKNKDVTRGIAERDVDLVTLDMENPEKAIKHARKALKSGGWIAIYSMHIEQARDAVEELVKEGFQFVRVTESLARDWQIEFGKHSYSRPKTHMIAHTGFLTFARKV